MCYCTALFGSMVGGGCDKTICVICHVCNKAMKNYYIIHIIFNTEIMINTSGLKNTMLYCDNEVITHNWSSLFQEDISIFHNTF